MEGKALRNIMVCCIVIMLLAGQSNGFGNVKEFEKCMRSCLIDCFFPPWAAVCPIRCTVRCVIHKPDPPPQGRVNVQHNSHRFCTAGCAASLCSRLISKNNYHLNKVEGCVDGCSKSCTNNYVPINGAG